VNGDVEGIKEDVAQLNRLAASISTTIRQQGEQWQAGLRSISQGLDAASARIGAALPGGPGSAFPAGPAAPAGAPAAAAAAVGIAAVRVINERGSPVPVAIVETAQRQEGRGLAGVLGGIGSAIGGFFGGLFGGLFSGALGPVISLVAGAELIVVAGQLLEFTNRVRALVQEIRVFTREFVTQISGLVTLIFDQLRAAGIFPVSTLVATLLLFIDYAITLVLSHIRPLIIWAERVVETIVAWLGRFISAVSSFIGQVVTRLAQFLVDYIDHIFNTIVRPAIYTLIRDLTQTLASLLFGAFLAFAGIISTTFTWVGNWLANKILSAVAAIPGFGGISVPPAPGPLDVEPAIRAGGARGAVLGRAFGASVLPPAPSGARPPAPTLRLPGFGAPPLQLPEPPRPEPLLERILRPGGAAAPPAGGAPPAQAPVTLNGGVSVQISAQRVDLDNAEETARVIAGHVLEEMHRLIEGERFRRGLPTAAVA
jgi:hypothetical protein